MFDRLIFAARLLRLIRRRDGNVSMIFGLCCIVVLCVGGLAIDATRAYTVKVELGNALDSAALAVGSTVPTSTTTAGQIAELTTRLTNYFNANFPKTGLWSNLTLTNDITSPNQTVVNVTASANVTTTVMRLLGFNTLTVTATTQITKGTNMLELALVLDNTGSMMCGDGGTDSCSKGTAHIDSLKTDAQQIVDTLFSQSADPSKLKISVVPYVTSVNVGGALCSGAKSCNSVAVDCAGNFVTDNGNTIYDTTAPWPVMTFKGSTTRNSATITNVTPDPSSIPAGIPITGSGIPSGAVVTSTTTSSITISSNATKSNTGETLTITGIYGYWTKGNPIVNIVYPPLKTVQQQAPAILANALPGAVVVGNNGTTSSGGPLPNYSKYSGIGVNNIQYEYYAPATSIQAVDLNQSTITLCQSPSASVGSASNPQQLILYPPVVYDTTNTLNTTNWKGCVVEPTASGEDTSGVGPDISEPSGGWTASTMGQAWSPFYWTDYAITTGSTSFNGGNNTWYVPTKSPTTQIQYTEIDGDVNTATNNSMGPNLSCPTPLVRLTSSQSTLDGAMQQMTSWANSGTAITVGMIWGWRTLSPNPPFGDAQPYHTPGLVKAVVLETDGDAQVAGQTQGLPYDFTGYGYIAEGNLGSTTAGNYEPYGAPAKNTANYNMQQRLTTLCNNMKAQGIIIYTIGLGDGANNQQLSDCAGPPGTPGQFFPAPTADDLQDAFKQIAVSLNQLRLSK